MTFQDLVKTRVLSQPTYEPGKPISHVAAEFGLDANTIAKLASNENPLGTSPRALEAAREALGESRLYPDGSCLDLRKKIARARGVKPEQIIVGNGSNEIIELLGHALLDEGDEVIMGAHAFIVYKLVALLFGATPVEIEMPALVHDLNRMREAVSSRTRIIFLPSPNNPTGTTNPPEEITAFVESLPDHVVFVLDEAYVEYMETSADLLPFIREDRNVICLRTFSKIYGMAGFRIGYGYGPAGFVNLLNRVRQPFNVNSLAQAAALGALDDSPWVEDCRRANTGGLLRLTEGFESMGIPVTPSEANFVLIRLQSSDQAKHLSFELRRRGIITRPVEGYGLPEYLRISVGSAEQNDRVLVGASEILENQSIAGKA